MGKLVSFKLEFIEFGFRFGFQDGEDSEGSVEELAVGIPSPEVIVLLLLAIELELLSLATLKRLHASFDSDRAGGNCCKQANSVKL